MDCPLDFVLFLIIAVIAIPSITPIKYNDIINKALYFSKNIEINIAYIGILAEQLINGTKHIVNFFSFSDCIVLIDKIAGTEHPNPNKIGTILFPDNPILLNGLSIINAILAIYPLSSSIDKKKYNVTIIGKKLSTLPIPIEYSIYN